MAETVLHLALRKITLASELDYSSDTVGLTMFRSRLRRIESELRMILGFLDQYETRYNSKQAYVRWIAEAQKLGYLVEETVDVYIHKLFHPFRRSGTSVSSWAILFASVPKIIEARRTAFLQLTELEGELEHLARLKDHWVSGFTDSERVPSTGETVHLSYHQLVSDFSNEEPVGFDEEKAKLTARLDRKDGAHPVVAVWGPAGSGKTTLVRFVYERKRSHFDYCKWMSMSGCSSAKDVLAKMYRELCVEHDTTNTYENLLPDTTIAEQNPLPDTTNTIENPVPDSTNTDENPLKPYLEALERIGLTKKFMIVLDDLKVKDGISKAHGLLKGSHIVIITRFEEVATQVVRDSINVAGLEHNEALKQGSINPKDLKEKGKQNLDQPRRNEVEDKALKEKLLKKYKINLAGLNDKVLHQDSEALQQHSEQDSKALQHDSKALQLFGRAVFGKGSEDTEELSKNYKDVMGTCPDECKGLPQVTISLGASLSLKQKSAVMQIKKQLDWVLKHNLSLDKTQICLYVAYINLPMHLKVCLLYCGIFPAGHLLLREKLVRLWVAEGFIEKQRKSEVDEEIAEGYLMVLTRCGFLHHVDNDELGRVASLRMPIVVHELVQSICRKEGFGIASEDVELPQADTNVRCLFISKYPQDIRPLIYLPHIRTLIASESAVEDSHFENPAVMSSYSQDTMSVEHKLARILLEELGAISGQRRFAYLTVLELPGYPHETLPHYITVLFNLRYLGLRKSKIRRFPEDMDRLYKMQTLDLESSNITKLPSWVGKLERLRHLLAGRATKDNRISGVGATKGVKKLKELQTLEIVEASADFVNSVGMLTQLRSLHISNVDSKSWRTLLDKMSSLRSLSKFAVSAKDEKQVLDVDAVPFEPLKSLELSCCRLGDHSLELLSKKFPNLESLGLYNVNGITNLEFNKSYFTKLRTLNLRKMDDVETLLVPVDALASLHVLHVESLANLNERNVGHEDKIRSIKKFSCRSTQLRDHPARTDVAESSSSASQP